MREEVISPEDYFDNGVIKNSIEMAINSLNTKSRLFSKYDHSVIYRLKLEGYSVGEIAKRNEVSASYMSTMINWIDVRLKKRLEFLTK